jgi:hypothetical protein
MITPDKIDPPVVEAWYLPNGRIDEHAQRIGVVNEYELNDFRIKIMNAGAEGYAVAYDNRFFSIDKDGRLPVWPNAFNLFAEQLSALIGL